MVETSSITIPRLVRLGLHALLGQKSFICFNIFIWQYFCYLGAILIFFRHGGDTLHQRGEICCVGVDSSTPKSQPIGAVVGHLTPKTSL